MKIRKLKYWCVVNPKGWPWPDTITHLKQETIRLAENSSCNTWEHMRNDGYRVAKITIQEVEK